MAELLRVPKLREWRFTYFEVIRSDEVSLNFLPLVRSVEVTPLGVGKECVLSEGLLVVVESRGGDTVSPVVEL